MGDGTGTLKSSYIMYRDNIDVATVIGYTYNPGQVDHLDFKTKIELSNYHGLQEMEAKGRPSEAIEIKPISKEQIDEYINEYSNPKLIEGLRRLAEGRENYYYNSAEDKDFVFDDGTKKAKTM